MGIAFLDTKSKRVEEFNIDGLIKDYYVYAGQTINAGDFVQFVTGVASQTTNSYKNSPTSFSTGSTQLIAVTKLSTTKVLLAYKGSDTYGYVRVVSISNATITYGTAVAFRQEDIVDLNVTYLSSSLAVVCFTTGYTAYAMACSISGTTVTTGSLKTVNSGSSSYPCDYVTIAYKSSTEALMCYSRKRANSSSTTYGARAVVLTVSGTSISTNTEVCVKTYPSTYLDVERVTTDKYIFCLTNHNNFGYAYMITTSGTSVSSSSGVSYEVAGSYCTKFNSLAVVTTTRSVVSYLSNGGRTGTATVIDTSGTLPVCGTQYVYYDKSNADEHISDTAIVPNMIFYTDGNNNNLYGIYYNVSDMTLTFGTNTLLLAENCSQLGAVSYNGSKTLLAYQHALVSYTGYARLYQLTSGRITDTLTFTTTTNETQVKKATANPFNGVAKTSGSGGTSTGHKDKVSIYVPNI